MAKKTISMKRYLELAQVFHWATKEHYQLMLTGKTGRHSRTEKILPRLVEKNKLVALPYHNRLIYSAPRRCRGKNSFNARKIEHGLACTECLVRIWLSKKDGEIISEKHFSKFRIIPEFGIRYPTGTLLLVEFSTPDNFRRRGLMRSKVERYEKNMNVILHQFNSERGVVLFIMEASAEAVKRFRQRIVTLDVPIYAVDWESFQSIKYGKQLSEPIYFWEDGNAYPLTK
jgi:hypothetical protein